MLAPLDKEHEMPSGWQCCFPNARPPLLGPLPRRPMNRPSPLFQLQVFPFSKKTSHPALSHVGASPPLRRTLNRLQSSNQFPVTPKALALAHAGAAWRIKLTPPEAVNDGKAQATKGPHGAVINRRQPKSAIMQASLVETRLTASQQKEQV